jgi:hypothetical protein
LFPFRTFFSRSFILDLDLVYYHPIFQIAIFGGEVSMLPNHSIPITADEFKVLESLVSLRKNKANAIFSTNWHDELWPSTRRGKTPISERQDVVGYSPVLDQLAQKYRAWRDEGGKIFINRTGAYRKIGPVGEIKREYFVHWRWVGDPPKPNSPDISGLTYPEVRALNRRSR